MELVELAEIRRAELQGLLAETRRSPLTTRILRQQVSSPRRAEAVGVVVQQWHGIVAVGAAAEKHIREQLHQCQPRPQQTEEILVKAEARKH